MSEQAGEELKVVIADDHPLMRSGVSAQLEGHADLTVVGTAAKADELVAVVAETQPDVIIADITLAGGSLFDVIDEVRAHAPGAKLIVLSASDEPAVVVRAVERGVDGFVTKEADSADLADHIRTASSGRMVLDERASSALTTGLASRARITPLSRRELEVLRGVADGKTNREIAASMSVSATTVKTLLERAFEKLGVRDRAAAVAKAKDARLL
jgi:DNA-binding NarL/FixJ family response regulator